jgi:hypothetical protein
MEGRNNQHHTAAEIEGMATHFVPEADIPLVAVTNQEYWVEFLRRRSNGDLGGDVDFGTPPNPNFGAWLRL